MGQEFAIPVHQHPVFALTALDLLMLNLTSIADIVQLGLAAEKLRDIDYAKS